MDDTLFLIKEKKEVRMEADFKSVIIKGRVFLIKKH